MGTEAPSDRARDLCLHRVVEPGAVSVTASLHQVSFDRASAYGNTAPKLSASCTSPGTSGRLLRFVDPEFLQVLSGDGHVPRLRADPQARPAGSPTNRRSTCAFHSASIVGASPSTVRSCWLRASWNFSTISRRPFGHHPGDRRSSLRRPASLVARCSCGATRARMPPSHGDRLVGILGVPGGVELGRRVRPTLFIERLEECGVQSRLPWWVRR